MPDFNAVPKNISTMISINTHAVAEHQEWLEKSRSLLGLCCHSLEDRHSYKAKPSLWPDFVCTYLQHNVVLFRLHGITQAFLRRINVE